MSDIAEILNVILTHAGSSVAMAVLAVVAVGEGLIIKYLLRQVEHRSEKLDETLNYFIRKTNGD